MCVCSASNEITEDPIQIVDWARQTVGEKASGVLRGRKFLLRRRVSTTYGKIPISW
jgi:hypothetical protein